MTEADAIQLLARWVYELRVDHLIVATRNRELERRVAHLEKRVNGFEFWMHSGLTPKDIYEAARELDPKAA